MFKRDITHENKVFIFEYHNAKICTIDGRDLFVASMCEGAHIVEISEHSTETQAIDWLKQICLLRLGKHLT